MLYREVLDDVVILVPGLEQEPFALTGGAHLWRLLELPHTTDQLLLTLVDGLAIPQANDELEAVLTRMAECGAVDRLTN